MKAPLAALLVFSLLIYGVESLTAQGHEERWNSTDILHYRFEIDLNDSTDIMRGKASLRVQFKTPAKELVLNLEEKQNEGSEKAGVGMKVKHIFIDGQKGSFSHKNGLLRIVVPSSNTRTEHNYIIEYQGIPSDGLIISKNKFGDRTFFGDNWPNRARHWLPVVDHPSDKATVEFLVSAPEHYGIVSIGTLQSDSTSKGRKYSHWSMEKPLSTKLMVIGVSPFAVEKFRSSSGIPVSTWVYPQNKKEGFSDYSVTLAPLDFFEHYIAPYPYSKLANVQSKTRYGGMENSSCIFFHERTVNGHRDQEFLFAHEIAHQWFGNAVSEASWHHIWLSEGFATYLTDIYIEQTRGRKAMWLNMEKEKQAVLDYAKYRLAPLVDTTLDASVRLLNANSYDKGAWTLHMLRNEVGDSLFRESLREFYRRYQFKNALTKDFRQVVEEVSGIDLETFFKQWVHSPGHPVLSLDWTIKGKKLQLTVKQHQNNPFHFPLEIGLETQNGKVETQGLNISSKQEIFSIKCKDKIVRVVADPDHWLLYEEF